MTLNIDHDLAAKYNISSPDKHRQDEDSKCYVIQADTNQETTKSTRDSEEQAKEHPAGNSEAPDGGWGWVIVFCVFLINLMNVGVANCWGLFYVDIQDKYQVSLTSVSWIGSVYSGVGSIAGLVIPVLIQRFGCRLTGCIGVTLMCGGFISSMFVDNIYILYVTASIIPGIGHGMQHLCYMTIVSTYFNKKRPLAIGLVTGGGGVGSIVLPPFVTFLLTTFGLRGSFLLLGGIILNEYWCDLTFRPVRYRDRHITNPSSSRIHVRDYVTLLKMPKMVLFLLSSVVMSLAAFVFLSVIPTIARRRIEGLTLEQAAFAVTVFGIMSMVSRILLGILATILHKYVLHFYIMCLWGCGIILTMVTITPSYPVLLAVSALYGVFHGGTWTLQPTVTLHLFELHMFTRAYGLILLATGSGSVVGVPFASFLADVTGNDMALFYMATTAFLLAGVLLVPLTLIHLSWRQGVHCIK